MNILNQKTKTKKKKEREKEKVLTYDNADKLVK